MTVIPSARSALFVPGDRPERFDKATAAGADLVICDLQDGVTPSAKADARSAVARWLTDGGRAVVRVNDLGSPAYEDDLEMVVGLPGPGTPGLLGIMLPMVDDPAEIRLVHRALGASTPLILLIESASGVHRAHELAAVEGVCRLAFGSIDLALDLDCAVDDHALLAARSTIVLASRLGRLPGPLDGVTTDIQDPTAAARAAIHARSLGFTGSLCIHPRQVPGINDAFTATAAQQAWARRVLDTVAARGNGALQMDGQMIDRPVIERAHRVLATLDVNPPSSPRTHQ